MKRAVITGMGAITPIGNSVHEYWNNLLQGKSGGTAITRFDTTNYKTKIACEVKNFNPLQYMDKKEARKTDLFTQYALAATSECMEDSQLDLGKSNRNRIGVIMATGIGGMITFEDEVLNFGRNGENPRFSPFFITKMIANMAAGQISLRYGLHGINYGVISACASSNNAIATALDLIRLGRADIIIAGGSEATISKVAIGGFNATKALSTLNDSPETASRPFSQDRDGFVLGEGAGVLMIEEMEHAQKRGAKIYCELAGYGAAADAYHVVATHPDGLGAKLAMEEALTDAKLKEQDVDYINVHATSTPVGDISECKAIADIFGNSLESIHLSATKSMTGHLLGAAGAVESIACVQTIVNGKIPPTINVTKVDPEINPKLNITLNKPLDKKVNIALNNTFGFGGHTVTTVFKKYNL
ncbi:beta-ketoacyl-[acyl-carrier-protein] synthase II [Mariniphaga sediminis]|jgi:3-oxoacyl-[acyl-carrier-protein] synthase II|uniref:3-oxoacyl-[acyl-carrier-protein] synthase 2 n=1 Tax=Mariniphaga sediminis TaxID=1628158 RepID=A0A399D2Z6_9BACT|nr:beta-ketoacyl-ACP synthase II [Mariniphaga sediminis]RIH66325.1 beta-ketoacyl-[acyl-carrier-protein] synthase II [Mariniphaga sediminis]